MIWLISQKLSTLRISTRSPRAVENCSSRINRNSRRSLLSTPCPPARETPLGMRRGFQRQFPRLAQIKLARSQTRQFFDAHELIASRPPQRGQIALRQPGEALFKLLFRQRVQDNQPLALFFVRNGRHYKHLLARSSKLLKFFLDL